MGNGPPWRIQAASLLCRIRLHCSSFEKSRKKLMSNTGHSITEGDKPIASQNLLIFLLALLASLYHSRRDKAPFTETSRTDPSADKGVRIWGSQSSTRIPARDWP